MSQLSIWEKESFFAAQDVIIIGSGFTGLWSALYLKELHPNYKITIIERGIIPSGASTRNAGFSCFGSPTELLKDVDNMGEDKTWELAAMRYKGLETIRSYFNKSLIDYDPCGGYECIDDSTNWDELSDQLNWLNKGMFAITGTENIFTVADKKLAKSGLTGFTHLIENDAEGGLHSGKLVQALIQKVQSLGVQLLTGIEIPAYEEGPEGIEVITNQGFSMKCRQLLLCTNAFTKQLVPEADIIPARGQVLLTAPVKGLQLKGTFHFQEGYYYFRNLGNRVLLGGGRNKALEPETTTEMHTTQLIQDELQQFLRKHILKDIPYQVTDKWSGIMAMGSEKMPIVKAISDNVFCCVRMSGMGVALAPVVAKQVATLMNQ